MLAQLQTQLALFPLLVLVIVFMLVALFMILSWSLLVLVPVLVFIPVWVTMGELVLVKAVVTLVLGDPISEMVMLMGLC